MKVGKPKKLQTQTPPGLPLTGEERSDWIPERHVPIKGESGGVPPSPLSERGSQRSCGVPTGVLLAGARGDRGGLDFVPYNKKLTALARENRKNPTAAESKLWNQLLRMSNLSGYKFSRQKPIGNYIADFYCAELHLVIEIDGDSHTKAVNYDAERTQILGTLGITVLRYANEDVLKNFPGVYDDLMRQIALLNVGNTIQ